MEKYTGKWADSRDVKRFTCVSCWLPEDSGTTPLTPDPWRERPHSDWPLTGDKLVSEKFHDPDKISECSTAACSEELIESPPPPCCGKTWLSRRPNIWLLSCSSKSSWTAFRTANSSRWLMFSYYSTCDHLPLADLCLKEATHPQFEAFVISRKLNKDSISLGIQPIPPPPAPEGPSTILPTLWPLCLVQNHRILSPFSPVSEGYEDVLDPSSQLPRNVWAVLRGGFDKDPNWQKSCDLVRRKHHSQFLRVPLQAQVFELLSGLQMAFLQVSPESSLV